MINRNIRKEEKINITLKLKITDMMILREKAI